LRCKACIKALPKGINTLDFSYFKKGILSMTRINRIVVQGFKSFAKLTEIPLGGRFNIVLGPNGSGKSNVTDAICFVLGKLGAKGLRAEKTANLIYDGGKTNKPSKSAMVAIHFDNSDSTFPKPEQEVIVSRRVLPSGSSIYKLNGKTVSRKEVIDLLSIAKIDPNGYNIILQGDIAKFTEMSPVSRREVIEEIADITLYEEKKHQALLELKKVDEKLNEAKIVLTERKTYLDELRVEHAQARKYKEMTERIEENRATYIALQIEDRQTRLNSLNEKAGKLDEEESRINSAIGKHKEELDKLKAEIESVNSEIEHKGEKGQIEMHNKIEQLRVEHSTNSARAEACKEELSKIAQRRAQLKHQHGDLQEKLASLELTQKELESQKKRLEAEKQELSAKLAQFRAKHKLEDTTKLEAELDELDSKAEQLSSQMLQLREEHQNSLREKDRLQIQLENIGQRIEKLAEVESQNKKELQQLKQIKIEFKSAIVDLNATLNEESSTAAKLSHARQELQASREELAKLRERRSSLNEQIAGNIAIRRILELKDKKVHGTVSSLGSVKSQYSLALEVAAGARLRDIVVDDVDTAVRCIRHLKQHKLGTATFLPLDKLKTPIQSPSSHKGAAGVHGLAIELINYLPKYEKVFRHVFRNTLVVDSLEVAKRLGVGTARMVTIDGDLAEASGAMIGGYRKKREQALGFQEEEVGKHLTETQSRVIELQKLVDSLEGKKQKAEEKAIQLKHHKAELEAQIIRIEKSLHLESEDLDATAKQKEVLKANLKAADKRLDESAKSLSALTKQLTAAKLQKEKLKQKLAQIKDPKVLAEMNSYEERLRKLQESSLGIESNLKNIGLQREEVYGKEQGRVLDILKQLDKEEAGFEKELVEKHAANERLGKQLAELEKKSEEFYSKYKALFKTRNSLGDSQREVEVNIASLNERLRGLELKRNSLSLDMATLKAQLAGLEEEFKPFANVKLLEGKTLGFLKSEISRYESMVAAFGSVNLKALDIYDQVQEEYLSLQKKREGLVKEKEDVDNLMHEIEQKKKGLFMQTFEILNKNFQSFFEKLSTKGVAYLRLENEENPFDGGVEIKVKLSGKRYMDIRSLSGGEKSMTALAFIFSIQEHEPATFYIMDEVDAALDKRNSEKLAKLISKYSDKAQYIVVSHNDYMIQEADTIFGVSMGDHNISKVISLKL
jgi:chromosome segregation protein